MMITKSVPTVAVKSCFVCLASRAPITCKTVETNFDVESVKSGRRLRIVQNARNVKRNSATNAPEKYARLGAIDSGARNALRTSYLSAKEVVETSFARIVAMKATRDGT